jgi:carbon-monoxide dehydrogenase medium subunit
MRPFDYSSPSRLDEAVLLLANTPGARILAGGSQLLVEPARSQLRAPLLVDLRRIDGLAAIERQTDGRLKIGAMTTLAVVASHEAVRTEYPGLVDAAQAVGDPQVRNRATLGGSLMIDDAAADLPAVMLALDAEVQIAGPRGPRTQAIDDLRRGAALGAGDVLTAVILPALPRRTGTAYEKMRNPATFYAVCGVAARVTLDGQGVVSACRVAVTGVGPSATRLGAVESALTGHSASGTLEAAANRAADGLAARSDRFASADYRRHLARVLTQRALTRAVERAGQ